MPSIILARCRRSVFAGLTEVARSFHSSVGEARVPLLSPVENQGVRRKPLFSGQSRSAHPKAALVCDFSKLSRVDTVQARRGGKRGGGGGLPGGAGGGNRAGKGDHRPKYHNPKTVNKKAMIKDEMEKRDSGGGGDDFEDRLFKIECFLDDLLSPGVSEEIAVDMLRQLHARAITTGVFNAMGPRPRKVKLDIADLYGKYMGSGQRMKVLQHH